MDVIPFEQFSKIVVGFGAGVVDGAGRRVTVVDIANRDDVAELGGVFEIAATASAAADQRDAGLVVGRGWRLDLGGVERLFDKPPGKPSRRAGKNRAFQNLTSGKFANHGNASV